MIALSSVLSLIALIISVIFAVITVFMNQRDKPNLMPDGQSYARNILTLVWKNTSDLNIRDLNINLSLFDNDLKWVRDRKIQDKYNFVIGEKSQICYGFNKLFDRSYLRKCLYIRVRFSGTYKDRIFPEKNFEQCIWYTLAFMQDGNGIGAVVHTTFKKEVELLKKKYDKSLKKYDLSTDKKFS
jgi:hypothetical protein